MTMVPDEGTFAVRAEPAAVETAAPTGPPREGTRWLLPAGALLLVAVLALYMADLVDHLSYLTAVRDLVVYRDGGLIIRHIAPAALAIAALRLWFRPARNPGTWQV
jgi:hypothetical protein